LSQILAIQLTLLQSHLPSSPTADIARLVQFLYCIIYYNWNDVYHYNVAVFTLSPTEIHD